MEITNFFQEHILALTPYASARDEYTGTEGVFLDANENPYSSADGQPYNRYPDPNQWAVKTRIGEIKGVQPNQIFLGNGSDEPIDLLIRAACEPRHDNILIMPPTYGMYQVCADVQNIKTLKVPLTPDFQIDTDAVSAAVNENTKIVWICSPNNPSGNLLARQAIIEILKNFAGLVVVDEAYIDFALSSKPDQTPDISFVSELGNYSNLVVLQTFSKAWGLAGLRLGMAFASAEIIKVLTKIKYPYNINVLTQRALLETLNHETHKNELVQNILTQREILRGALLLLPFVVHIYPSNSNMLLVRFEDSKAVFDYLLGQKIIVRDRSKVLLCEGCLRISVGTEQENQSLIDTLNGFASIRV